MRRRERTAANENTMARWIALFEDHDEDISGPIRKQHGQAHFDYLATHAEHIRLGGGLRRDPGEWYCGGLWVLEVADRAEAVALVEADPYYKLGLRKTYRLFTWGKAPCYGDVIL
jgi:hypothetical protein